jgi:hypothetical protein
VQLQTGLGSESDQGSAISLITTGRCRGDVSPMAEPRKLGRSAGQCEWPARRDELGDGRADQFASRRIVRCVLRLALTVGEAMRVVAELIATDKTSHGFLGARYTDDANANGVRIID